MLLFISTKLVNAYTISKTQTTRPVEGLSNGLVGHWTFDGGNMINNVTDSSGNGNNGILVSFPATSTVIVPGKVGQALTFNNDYVSINDSSSLRPSSVTISFWLFSNGSNLEYLIFKDKSSDASFYIQNNNSSSIKFCTTGGTCTTMSNSGFIGNWTYITAVLDGTTGYFYKNGIYQNQNNSMNAIDYTSPLKLYLGYSSNAPTAIMDDVRIYSRALSANEIKQLYNLGGSKISTVISRPAFSNIDSGMVGYWTFDGKNLINNVTDSSGSGNTGTLQNFPATSSAVVSGKVGQSLIFDGVDDYVKLPDSASLEPSSLTISAWIKRNGPLATNQRPIVSLHFNDVYLYIANSVNGLLYCGMNGLSTLTGTSVTPDVWHHVAVTYNGSLATLYLDGVSVDTKSGTLVWEGGTHYPRIGSEDSGTYFFGGNIDDVRIYNKALSSTDIRQLYNSSTNKISAVATKPSGSSLTNGLVMHLTFDGKNLINNAVDSSGSGNTGYLKNMSTTTAVTAGRIGQALTFDGVNDYVRVAPSSTLNDMGPLTYAAWVYLPVAPGSENDLIGKRRRLFYLTNLLAPATVLFFTSNDTTNTSVRSNTAIALNKWTHVAVVWNGQIGAGLSCDFYINGALTSKTTFNTGSNNVLSDTAFDMTVGAYADGASGFVNGKIDDVRAYNRMLSATEIYQLYTLGK